MDALEKLKQNGIALSPAEIELIAERYNIKEISVFGSSVRSDFSQESDIDLLIEFKHSESISLFDLIDIQEYFEKLTQRSVDIVEPTGLKNPYRKKAILATKEILYVA